jgi:hypothetical protein
VDAPGAAERRALAGDVGRGRPARGEQPLGERGVEAAGDRVLVDAAVLVGERADLERLGRSGRVGRDDADVELVVDGLEREHRLGVVEQDPDPAGAVVDPLRVRHVGAADAEHPRHALDVLVLHRAGAQERRRGEREPRLRAPDRHEPGAALLHDRVLAARRSAGLQPRVAGPERRVPGERQLPQRREDPHAVVGVRGLRRQHERRLGQVRPAGEPLHRLLGQPGAVQHDRHRIAHVGLAREDVDLGEWARHEAQCCKGARRAPARRGPSPTLKR